jgi:hypothetical protein
VGIQYVCIYQGRSRRSSAGSAFGARAFTDAATLSGREIDLARDVRTRFERVGYGADIAGLEREFGRTLTKLPGWARPARLANPLQQ